MNVPTMSRASLDAATFATLAERFAAESSARSPSWTYVNAAAQGSASPFSMSPKGYLKASPCSPPTARCDDGCPDSSLGEETGRQEEETITNLLPPAVSSSTSFTARRTRSRCSCSKGTTPTVPCGRLTSCARPHRVMKGGGQAGVRPEVAEHR